LWWSSDYPERTRANVRDSDGTLWFGATDTPGARATIRACLQLGCPCLRVEDVFTRPSHVATWISENQIEVRNVAGNRVRSKAPGHGDRGERFLAAVLRRLGHEPV
jgi:hypothetical protein